MSDDDRTPEPLGADALPGLARVAATSMWRTSGWAVRTYVGASRRIVGVALRPDTAPELIEDLRHAAGDLTRSLLGDEGAERVRAAAADSPVAQNPVVQRMADAMPGMSGSGSRQSRRSEPVSLHDQGEELMRRSRDVRYEEPAHPAHERILTELAPDEGRILRLLLQSGPQPAVDVRTGGPIGMFSSRLIAPGLNMIGARAGCRYVDRVPSYLNNLYRLGLIWFSRETLRDPHEYQVVEAQPEVLGAMKSVGMAKIVRRSIHLTPFGADFCRVALALDTSEFDALPTHGAPEEDKQHGEPPSAN